MTANEIAEKLKKEVLDNNKSQLTQPAWEAVTFAIAHLEKEQEPPQWDNMIDALKQNQFINPAANIAIEYMRNHPNDNPKVVVGFVTSVINGIKEL